MIKKERVTRGIRAVVSDFVARGRSFLDVLNNFDLPVPGNPIMLEVQRIKEGAQRGIPGIERKDIPKLLEALADQDSHNIGIVVRTPNGASTIIGGMNVSVHGLSDKNDPLRVVINGQENIVHDPALFGDILMRKMERK